MSLNRFSQFDTELYREVTPARLGLDRRSPEYLKWLQRSLNQVLGLSLDVDGLMGRRTRRAIVQFQNRANLAPDGEPGAMTERALVNAGAPPFGGGFVPPVVLPPSPPGGGGSFIPVPIENPGGGRVKDKTPPSPSNLTRVKGVGKRVVPLHKEAARAWTALVQAARADGIQHPLLLPVSGFRDPKRQARLWKRALEKYKTPQKARKWVAPPGRSAHQSGRAIDFWLGGKNSSGNVKRLRQLRSYQWMVNNAQRFGFYPYEKEPWHWEYNPPQI